MEAGNPHVFQPLSMGILKSDKDKADWQDQDVDIKIMKEWVKDGQQLTGQEMNFKTQEVLVYRKVLSALKLIPVEGTNKTILVKQ